MGRNKKIKVDGLMREKFDSNWSNLPFKFRGMRLLLNPTDEARGILERLNLKFRDGYHHISKTVHQFLEENGLSKINTRGFEDNFNKHPRLFDLGLVFHRWRRSVCYEVVCAYDSYRKRNKKNAKRPIQLKGGKAIVVKDDIVDIISNNEINLVIDGPQVKKAYTRITIPFTVHPSIVNRIQYISSYSGGSIFCRHGQWVFSTKATIPYEWTYEPVHSIGFDLNKTGKTWLTFSEPFEFDGDQKQSIKLPTEIKKVIERIRTLNREISNREIRSAQRSAVRRKWKACHQRLEKLCYPICDRILNYVVKRKLLLCIDGLSCGARTGSFGQDKIISFLVKRCEDQGIPFVVVPTPDTTKTCSFCGNMKKLLPSERDYECDTCGLMIGRDVNSAINIAMRGWDIWHNGIAKYNKRKHEVEDREHNRQNSKQVML